MTSLFAITSGTWAALLAVGLLEKRFVGTDREKIPNRIVVGGARGKSSLVRLLHAGYTAVGIPAAGRVTGDAPVLMDTRGNEIPIHRRGMANIRELRTALRQMARWQVQTAIIENMAIDYTLQNTVCHDYTKPTLVVVAPDATDHLECWPLDPAERARAFLATVPAETPLLFVPSVRNRVVHQTAVDEGRAVHWPELLKDDALPTRLQEAAGAALFALRLTHPEYEYTRAQEAILSAARQMAPLYAHRLTDVVVMDLMSANDPESTTTLLDEVALRAPTHGVDGIRLLYNHRSDRPARLASFLSVFDKHPSEVIGDPIPLSCARVFPRHTCGNDEHGLLVHLLRTSPKNTLNILVGNSGGLGKRVRAEILPSGERMPW